MNSTRAGPSFGSSGDRVEHVHFIFRRCSQAHCELRQYKSPESTPAAAHVLDNLIVGTTFDEALAIPGPTLGDYDGNGSIGPEDYEFWKANFGSSNLDADGNGDGKVDAADNVVWRKSDGTVAGYDQWQANFGRSVESAGALTKIAAPEPLTCWLLANGLACFILSRLRPRSRTDSKCRGNGNYLDSLSGLAALPLWFIVTLAATVSTIREVHRLG